MRPSPATLTAPVALAVRVGRVGVASAVVGHPGEILVSQRREGGLTLGIRGRNLDVLGTGSTLRGSIGLSLEPSLALVADPLNFARNMVRIWSRACMGQASCASTTGPNLHISSGVLFCL